ncbi:MAG TPA: HNH endonuclease family protein [Microthrixaceae bacterium]|nr:HNH endonuclease family protein [Microthrixaceae bacterium]
MGVGDLDALDVLGTIPVNLEHRGGYNRDLFAVWSDLDGDGCDTRSDVLISESHTPATIGTSGCSVITGNWYSTYDGLTFTDAASIEIDHVVPLKEAWDSGAWQWSALRRVAFANDTTDPRTLAAVSSTSNRAKGDKDPSNWLPQDADVCTYVTDWIAIKARWSLSMDESEFGRIRNLLEGPCRGTTVSHWPPPVE